MLESKKKIGILKLRYRKVLEVSLLVSLFMVATLFYSFKTFNYRSKLNQSFEPPIIVVKIPQTKQNKPKPPPNRPQIPVEAEDDELLDDVTIDDTNIDYSVFSTEIIPPPDEPVEIFEFFAVSEKPILIKKIQPQYPPLAIAANIEGTVTVKILIDTKGNIEKAEIFKSIPMLNNAAIQAALQYKFTPAKQFDKYVKVWMSIPFKFSLRSRSM